MDLGKVGLAKEVGFAYLLFGAESLFKALVNGLQLKLCEGFKWLHKIFIYEPIQLFPPT